VYFVFLIYCSICLWYVWYNVCDCHAIIKGNLLANNIWSTEHDIRKRIAMERNCVSSLNHNIRHSSITIATKLWLYRVFSLPLILYGAETWFPTQQLSRNIHALISGVCVAYYEFPEGITFQRKRSTDVPTSHHSRISSIPSLATSHLLIHLWNTAECSDPVWPTYQGTGTSDQADLVKPDFTQLNLMSHHLTLIWQLPIIEHKIDRHGGRSCKWQHPLDKPHDDDNDG